MKKMIKVIDLNSGDVFKFKKDGKFLYRVEQIQSCHNNEMRIVDVYETIQNKKMRFHMFNNQTMYHAI